MQLIAWLLQTTWLSVTIRVWGTGSGVYIVAIIVSYDNTVYYKMFLWEEGELQ